MVMNKRKRDRINKKEREAKKDEQERDRINGNLTGRGII